MARISAWAVGAPVASRAFAAAASSRPSASITSAPTGRSSPEVRAISIARSMSPSGVSGLHDLRQLVGEPAAAGDRGELLVRVEVDLLDEHGELVSGHAQVGEHADAALRPRGVVGLVLVGHLET